MTHPYSIFVWQAPLGSDGEGHWEEPVQVAYQEYALYLANLIHRAISDMSGIPYYYLLNSSLTIMQDAEHHYDYC